MNYDELKAKSIKTGLYAILLGITAIEEASDKLKELAS